MTTIKIQGTNKVIDNQKEVVSFLEDQGVIYEHWDTKKLPAHLQNKFLLDEDEKGEILEVYKTEIEAISTKRGYKSWDIISLSESTPNLDDLLKKFERKHIHTDDEVRFIVSGHGIFIIQGKDEHFFEVHLNPGDLISVPENVKHYFTLTDDRKVVAVRIFVTEKGWVPVYEDENVTSK